LISAAALALAGAAIAASSETISNIATISWDAGGARLQQSSNRVDLDVTIADTVGLTTYRLTNGSSQTVSLGGASCRGNQHTDTFPFAGIYEGINPGAAPIVQTQDIHAGDPLVIEIDRPSANHDANAVEKVTVVIKTTEGDSETLTLVESGANTGHFFGIVATIPSPPPGVSGDCQLSVVPGDKLTLSALDQNASEPFAASNFNVLVDPFGIAFNSADGGAVDGTRITVVDADTGAPAEVFGDDGVSSFPSAIVTGSTVTDSAGRSYVFPPGEYRFPRMRPGHYRLKVEPPAPYLAPSTVPASQLAQLTRPDGGPFVINAGSYGGVIVLAAPLPVQVDLPLDKPTAPIALAKTASVSVAEPGDSVQYRLTLTNPSATQATGAVTITDLIPPQMRLRLGTVRIDGNKVDPVVSDDGQRLEIPVPSLAPSSSAIITYVLEVRQDARASDALNRAEAVDSRGLHSNIADAAVRIRKDVIAGRMTIIGRVVDADCGANPSKAKGIPGVRIMLEDGSYAVSDLEGRYHFEGVQPGLHVVQLDDQTLPADRAAVDCARDARSGGRAFSRFVEGYGGALKRVDFRAAPSAPRANARMGAGKRPAPLSDPAAAGAERDWFADQQPGIAWLFPEEEYNPRAPVVRVAIKHVPGQSIRLLAGGKPVDPIAFDGTRKSGDGQIAISLWRGIPLAQRDTVLTAEVRDAAGTLVQALTRKVHFAPSPMQATLLRDKSVLIADGVTPPVIALRMTDRDGRPVHHGLVGDFQVPAPYYPAIEADAQQARQLAGLERAKPVWRVEGDDGIAYVELEPTTASGSVSLRFTFRDGEAVREQRVEAWLEPGDRPWTIVGLAEGTVGYAKLKGYVEALDDKDDGLFTDGRIALYAKGRISGKWLMTLAYDSDKKEDDSRFGGTIDPGAYYTVYADRSERRYDAASIRKFYLKLERPQFYALFGDYETGIDEPQLARYVRSFNGVKAEYRSDRLSATAFASDTPNRYRRDEIQGNGLSGPYPLGAHDLLANGERVTLEVRDRLRSDRIVDQRVLSRHVDYDIDYLTGTIRFREPILSRDSDLNPQFIIVEYEVDGIASRSLNAGGRVSWRTADQKLQVAATAIQDKDDTGRTLLGGADVRYRPNPTTEVRAEVAVSDSNGSAASSADGTKLAWLVEAEHHGPKFDVLAYARQQDRGFGVGQQNLGENGTRKVGIDGRLRIGDKWTLSGSAWHEDYLESDARRIAGKALIEYHGSGLAARAGITFAGDRLEDGRTSQSQILQFGVTKKLFGNRLELDAQTEFPIGGKDNSVDFPARHRLSARFAVTRDVHLVGAYEIAQGDNVDARTARIGFDLTPWAGARIAASANVQDIAEYGLRTFASLGLAQSVVLDKHWSVDLSLDSNKTLHGIDPSRVLNPLHPVASGGFIGSGDTLTEDFVAVTAGATYRSDLWSITGRAEYRAGDRDDRYGFTAAALRQIGEGSALGGSFSWFTAKSKGGAQTRTLNLQLSWAHRPTDSALSWMDKLEVREDSVKDAVVGLPAPIGGPLTVTGDARSRRIINSLSVNWSPSSGSGEWLSEVSLFWGTRYVTDRYGDDDIKGWSNILGGDLRFDVSDTVDIGASATIRAGIGARSFAYSGGPNLGIKPFDNGWILIGWNVVGFHDRDFEEARYSRSGPYVTMRLKFDQLTLQALGLGDRR
jgi:uncharacterized repeat protein (TIGR01451 family)